MFTEQLAVMCLFYVLVKGQIDNEYYGIRRGGDDDFQYSQDADLSPVVGGYPHYEDPKLQRFMNELIKEAGLHFLYPPKDIQGIRLAEGEMDNTPEYPMYDRSKGQPEYIDLLRKRKVERDVDCPTQCFSYWPVCGSDGKVYDSECHFLKANCGLQNVTIVDWESCRGRHFLCPVTCLDINDPVCGGDGRIYHNICVLRKQNCGKLLATKPIRFCYSRGREPKMFDSCPEDCQEVYNPVCGSDGVVYYNICFMKMRTCGQNLGIEDLSKCVHKRSCPERCIPIYDPVCGSDGKIYPNVCKMLLENCGSDVKKMPESFCGGIKRG